MDQLQTDVDECTQVRQVLPPFQIIRHSKNLGESKHLKFDQNYRENYKNL
jgi:hypothetical protein